MNLNVTPRTMALLFPVVLVAYLATFYGCERWRAHNGPWEVTFTTNALGQPVMRAAQTSLHLSNVQIAFAGESFTNAPETVRFDRVLRPVPFGKVIFEDLTALPGVITLDLFGHEIELLPRVLIVNKKEVSWQSGLSLVLSPTNKPAIPPKPPKPRKGLSR